MAKDEKNMQAGIKLKSRSGYAKLVVKPYPAKKAKQIVNELMELAKSIEGMKTITDVGECPCDDCSQERRRAEILAKGKIVVIRGDRDKMENLAEEIEKQFREAVNNL